ncbi:MAG: Zn-dependent exopeptidase M28 [Actinobacteria bacterium]|nr:Zn-dependent exopeptidase M28 [Actinomycetota bacterium]MBU1943816.1 Zn-dependent exopeptidase M28 [Actinomycetota bacterium]MBU2689023.1 Zn-dependent exopeptidase M28 [Actinomycetota bacterium]
MPESDANEHLEYLVNRCGDRRVATPGNRMAAEYIASVLGEAGYDVAFEEFDSPGGVQAAVLAAMLTGWVASRLMCSARRGTRLAGAALAALMAGQLIGENTTLTRPADVFLRMRRGCNVLAASSDEPRVVVVAHYDTVNQGEAFKPSRARFVPAGFVVLMSFPLLAVVLSRPCWRWPGRIFRLTMLVGAASMLHWSLAGGWNPGANDNASSVAVALAAAERIGGDEAADRGVWFLLTDAEEAGLRGMASFRTRHAEDLAGARVLNLESMGSGSLHYIAREGWVLRRRPSRDLVDTAERYCAARGLALQNASGASFETDAAAALAGGFDAITLCRLDGTGFIPRWHYRDRIESIDREILEESADLVAGLVQHLTD